MNEHSYVKRYLKIILNYFYIKKETGRMICTPFTGQTSKGGIYYALLT